MEREADGVFAVCVLRTSSRKVARFSCIARYRRLPSGCRRRYTPPHRYTVRKGSALDAKKVWSYRSHTRVAVELRLQLLSGEQPWVAEGAMLVDAHGREVPVLPLWQSAPVAPGPSFQSVVVEAEATAKEAQGPYTLNLWDMGGARSVTVEGVVFPPAPGSTAR